MVRGGWFSACWVPICWAEEGEAERAPGGQHVQHGQKAPRALRLLIYSPMRGVLDAWPLRFGDRVASLRVPKNGRLLYQPALLVQQQRHGDGEAELAFPLRCFVLVGEDQDRGVAPAAGKGKTIVGVGGIGEDGEEEREDATVWEVALSRRNK